MAVNTYQCLRCGGEIKFNPELQKCKCDYCLSEFTIEEIDNHLKKQDDKLKDIVFEDLHNAEWDNMDDNTIAYSCSSCGAQIVTEKTTSATSCCYCHNPVVIVEQISGEFRPSKIIPFKFNKQSANDTFLKWCKKKWFLPMAFSPKDQLDNIYGIYIPYWLFTCDVTSQLHANAQNVQIWRSGDYRYTKTDRYAVYRQADMTFSNIPNDGSSKADDKVMEAIEPFDYNELKDFSLNYLAGFLAEKYDVDKKDVFPKIQHRINNSAKELLRSSIKGYSTVAEASSSTLYNNTASHYALFPIWMLTYIYKNKTYTFAMNGQTGKVFGLLPVSFWKLAFLFLCIFAVVFAIVFFGGRP